MKLKAFAVIDTNVVVSSFLSGNGFPHEIFSLVESGNVIPIFDKRVLDEYYRVLNYDKFKFSDKSIYDALHTIVSKGIMINDVMQVEEYFKDRDDVPFYEVTMSAEEFAPHLVTGNIKHFPQSPYVVVPQVMLATMNYMDKFLKRDWNYDKTINDLIQMHTSGSKYAVGKELVEKIFDTSAKTVKKSYFERD